MACHQPLCLAWWWCLNNMHGACVAGRCVAAKRQLAELKTEAREAGKLLEDKKALEGKLVRRRRRGPGGGAPGEDKAHWGEAGQGWVCGCLQGEHAVADCVQATSSYFLFLCCSSAGPGRGNKQ